jgi:carbamoyl-phosphate synthase large subunit
MNTIITSAGRRVSLVRAFQKEARLISEKAKVFTIDMNPSLSAACQIADASFKVNSLKDPEYMNDLLRIAVENEVRIIVPTLDTELLLLAENKKLFAYNGISVVVSESDFIKKCRDKRLTNQFFVERGIGIPKEIDKNNPSFPLFIKPFDGSLSADIFLINNSDELLPSHLNNPRFMFMEYVDKSAHEEFTVDMYYGTDNLLKCIVPRKRIEIRGGEISKGITVKNNLMDEILSKLNHIEGAVGCLTTQFFRNIYNGNIYGIEINPRFGGGYPLSYHANANYPGYIYREYIQEQSVSYFDGWEEGLLMLRYDDEVFVHGVQAE